MLAMFSKRISAVFFLLLTVVGSYTSTAQNYPPVFDQNTLNGRNGFSVTGLNERNWLGSELSFAGDINNDGLEDVAIYTQQYIKPVDGFDSQGTTYIIFGSRNAFPSPFDLTTLNGTNGFKVVGIAENERRGRSIGKLGDINGDGIDDISLSSQGDKHIFLYGKTGSFPASLSIADIDGTNGFIFTQSGVNELKSAGDVNGDGINDIIMGQYAWSGTSYIILGRNGNFPLNINSTWLDGTKGFVLGAVDATSSAFFVGTAGDINNDGYDDLMVGIHSGRSAESSLTYVYFGHAAPFSQSVDLKSVNGTNGFSIQNIADFGYAIIGTLGDINGDGIDDCFSKNKIIYGSSNPGAFTNNFTVNGTNGFTLTGYPQTSAAIGDINRDGIDDFITVAADGVNWVIFGSTQPFSSTFDPAILDGVKGFKIENLRQSNNRPVSGDGDINGDGFSDFMFSSEGQGTGASGAGEHGIVYVVFSGDHFAKPLTTAYPKAINIDITKFTLQVNTVEKGKVYYAVYNGGQTAITNTATITSGTGALQFGTVAISQTSTNVNKVLTGLAPNTQYDVYVYFEDDAGNRSQIYKLDNVTTLADTQAPVITCPANKTLSCGLLPNYVSTIAVVDNVDATPTVTQSPAAGTAITPNMLVTITAKDDYNNTRTCTFTILVSNTVSCPGNQTLVVGSALPNYTSNASVTGFCTGAPDITQTPAAGTLITNNMTVTVTAVKDNSRATCSFVVNPVTTAIDVSSSDASLVVYPNPAKDVVYVKGLNYDSYEIIDNLGSLVLQGGSDTEIPVSNLSQGIYVMLFYDANHQVVAMKRVIKN